MNIEEAIPDLFDVVGRYGGRPDVPLAADDFFTSLANKFDDRHLFRQHLEELVPGMYRCLRGQPEWIQEANWPWSNSRPMVYVGSIDAPEGTFHDDGRFFLFWCPESGTAECIIQVA